MRKTILNFFIKRDLKINKLTKKIEELKEIINQKEKRIELAEKRATKNIKMARQISRDFNEYEFKTNEEIESLKKENKKLKRKKNKKERNKK